MTTILVVPHPERREAVELARSIMVWLTEGGHDVRVEQGAADACGLEKWSTPRDVAVAGLQLAISFGGDGTMLRTVDMVGQAGVPVLGVNFGALGYLTQVEPADLRRKLDRFFAGDFEIEERMTLDIRVDSHGGSMRFNALNEAVLEKTVSGHVVQLAISIDSHAFLTYAADGVIVATPTGSTAYNLSARGPIASPNLNAIIMTPVSPHMLFDRALILDSTEEVRLEVLGKRAASLVVDGSAVDSLDPGDIVTCRAGSHPARLVSFGQRDFHSILKKKFELADR